MAEKLKTDTKTGRSFKYSKGEITLDFSLNIDSDYQPKAFLEMLNQAILDVQETIDEIKYNESRE